MDLAQSLIQTEGSDAVSFRTLAEGVGVKSSSVHYYFSTKDDLLFELSDRYSANFRKELQKISSAKGNTMESLGRLIEIFKDTAKAGKICFCGALSAISERLDQRTLRSTQRFVEELVVWVETTIEIGQEKGDIGNSVEARSVAQSIVALLEGALLLDRLGGSDSNLKHSDRMIRTMLK